MSFESIQAGATRADALERAGRLAEAGIRVVSMAEPGGSGGAAWRLVVGAADAPRARALLDPPH